MRKRIPTIAETRALARMLIRYWLTIAATVRTELHHWEHQARRIPDPELRAHALAKLRDEHLNAEAAATFAGLVDRRHRKAATRLMVAFEVMYDYLDAVTEQPVSDPLVNGRQLHAALTAVFETETSSSAHDYYVHHPGNGDGGYLGSLVSTCQTHFRQLPSAHVIAPIVRRATTRCAEAQTRTHAVPTCGERQLSEWAAAPARAQGLAWWEYAAGATASLAIHALFAAAADPTITHDQAEQIEAAYHPAIGALATMLDSLIDHEDDDPETDHRYVAYYPNRQESADRIAGIAGRAAAQTKKLSQASSHAVIVAGIACFYLSTPQATTGFPSLAARRILTVVGPLSIPILAVLRRRRTSGIR